MNKAFIQYLLFGFLGSVPLNLLLFWTFDILSRLGIPNDSNRVLLFFVVYLIEIPLYMLIIHFYLKAQSEKNLEKLKKDVEQITGKKLQ